MSEILHTFRRKNLREKAATLVVTLLVLTLLSTIVVAFVQTVSLERSAARSVANRYQAELAADAAVEQATSTIMATIQARPASAVYYTSNISASNTLNLYLARYTNVSGNLSIQRVPLFSTQFGNFTVFNNLSQAPIQTTPISVTHRTQGGNVTSTLSSVGDIYTSLNSPTNQAYPSGPVGLTINATSSTPRPLFANWIYVTNSFGTLVGRYAYWVDDESSKLDLRTIGSANRTDGTNLSEITASSLRSLSANITPNHITNITLLKNATQLPHSTANIRFDLGGQAVTDTQAWNAIRPFITQYSLYDQRSPDGNLAINLNEFVTTTTSAAEITTQVNTIATAITNNIPTFGTRYYQATGPASTATAATPSADDQLKYAKKIAANIRDFIDMDSTATLIDRDGLAYTGTSPDFSGKLPLGDSLLASDVPLVGKEKGPFLNEYAVAYRIVDPVNENTTSGATSAVTITVRFAHYIELFNITSQNITFSQLGPNPRVIIANQLPWINNLNSELLRPADIVLRLPTNFYIPAGGYAVLTTDGPPFQPPGMNQTDYFPINTISSNSTYFFRRTGNSTWSLLGTGGQNSPLTNSDFIDYQISTKHRSDFQYDVQMNSGLANNGYSDCRERLLLVNDNGIIDFALRVNSTGNRFLGRHTRNPTSILTFPADGESQANNTNPEDSNTPRIVRGDPRSNTEIIQIDANTSAVWKNGDSPQYGNVTLTQMRLGEANFNWAISTATTNISRVAWAEYHPTGNGFVSNANMTSSGDLGFIFDPARYSSSGYRSISRTLRVGQPDRPDFNRNNNSSAALDTNWIGGLGHGNTTHANYARSASMIADVFRFDTNTFGKLNPNGLARATNSPILPALFDGFRFSSATNNISSGTLNGTTINTNALLTAITNEFAANRPFIGVGDISRLQVFATSNTTSSIATGQNMAAFTVSDADREEVFRRTAGLVATQSLAFTVHAIGQTGMIVNNEFIPSATQQKQVILQFQPQYSTTTYPATPSGWTIQKPWQKNL
jgi:Tfp pilus assembly protein PilX